MATRKPCYDRAHTRARARSYAGGGVAAGGGPRGCPGRYLAVDLMKVAVRGILQRYKLTPAAGGPREGKRRLYKFVEYPVHGAFVHLSPREPLR